MQYVWDIVHVHWGVVQSVLEHLAKSEQRDAVHCRIHPDASVTSPVSSVFRHTYVCHNTAPPALLDILCKYLVCPRWSVTTVGPHAESSTFTIKFSPLSGNNEGVWPWVCLSVSCPVTFDPWRISQQSMQHFCQSPWIKSETLWFCHILIWFKVHCRCVQR